MKVITTISNEDDTGFNILSMSCIMNNLELVALHLDGASFEGNRVKDELLYAYLHDVEDEEIILFTDGYDALFMTGEDEILHKFHQCDCDILFSAETNCWPDANMKTLFPLDQSPNPYQYLNSGGFIGKAHLIKKYIDLLDYSTSAFENSNQYLWSKLHINYPDQIKLDADCEIFCTFSPEIGQSLYLNDIGEIKEGYLEYKKDWFEKYFQLKDGRIFNKITNSWPCHAHFNGISKSLMNSDILNQLFNDEKELNSSIKTKIIYASY